jgi:acyl-CoA synthetase (AMP-forming)/AMP-acid ligase II
MIALAGHPREQLCAVIGLPNRIKGEIPVACILPRAGAAPAGNRAGSILSRRAGEKGGQGRFVRLDVTSESEWREAIAATLSAF